MRIRELFEAPLPDDWDKGKFSPRTTFKDMVAYAKERASQLGVGSSRIAFEIPYKGRETVLKVAKNNKGIVQNQEEARLLTDWYVQGIGIVIPVIDHDKENGGRVTWIHTEKAKKISKKQLESFFGGVSMDSISADLEYQRTGRRGVYGLLPDEIFENEYYQMLQDLVLSLNIPSGDFTRKANWGIYKGRPVIIDLGFTETTQKLYR